jgi:site-specific DNA-cytosine methylase
MEVLGGGNLVFVADNEPGPSAILATRHPDVRNLGDITVLDWHAIPDADIWIGGYPCFTADALVLTRSGYRPITDVKIGDLVLTHRRRWRPVTAVMAKNAPETVEIHAHGTMRTRCTPDHPWWTENGTWVTAKELAHERIVQVLPEAEDAPTNPTPEVLWVLGRHLADGYIQHRKGRPGAGRVTITCAHEEADEVQAGLTAAGMHGYVTRQRTATKLAITRNDFYQLALQCGQGAGDKSVPGWLIANLDQPRAKALLSGYLSGDGYRDEINTTRGYTSTTVSKALAYSMALVAQRAHGIVCTVRLNRVPPPKTIEGRTVRQRPFWTLGIPDHNRSGRVTTDHSVAYKLCRTVELAGPARVYNLAVAEDESYVVDNAVVHNCQPFSDAGGRKGTEDERHIWPFIAAGLRARRPRQVVLENVPGHLGRGFDVVLADLARLGYSVRWTVIRAADAGYCHRRARIFAVAALNQPAPGGGLLRAVLQDGVWLQDEGLFGSVPFPAAALRDLPSGYMTDGCLYELPAGTGAGTGIPLLPTPAASQFNDGESLESWEARNRRLRETWSSERYPRGNGNGMGTPLPILVRQLARDTAGLLPTPNASDWKGSGQTQGRERRDGRLRTPGDMDLPEAVDLLLKTPTAQLAVNGGSQPEEKRRAGGHGPTLADQVEHMVNWGRYERAVRRQERVSGRAVPSPVEPGRDGAPRLAALFVEWMMGLPAGFVTGVPGLSRTDQLRALGNGVVPAQGVLALKILAGFLAERNGVA